MWPIGTCFFAAARIQAGPHGARDLAVQRRHGIGAPRQASAPARSCRNLRSGLYGSTRPQAMNWSWLRPSDSRSGPKCSSISCGENRSWPAGTGVCVVNTTWLATRRAASSAANPFGQHPTPHHFQGGKRAVPFVQMHDARRNRPGLARPATPPIPSISSWRMRAALVAAVQPGRQFAVFRLVSFDVGIEQQQRVAAHGQTSKPGP